MSRNSTRDAAELVVDRINSIAPQMLAVKRLIAQVATTDIAVLILGESGTGKELAAQAIHESSPRHRAPLVAVNCGAIPEGIFESEVFGHEKGAFTSAEKARRGYFEMAHRGTLFLDEVGETPLPTQVKLLRVLETGKFLRVGGGEEIAVDVRIVAATNRDLEQEVARGRFRQDLYFRLKTVMITLPPLRERPEDIPLLIKDFSAAFAERNHRPLPEFERDGIDLMQRHYWPGNIRELKNFVESLIALSQQRRITYDSVIAAMQPAGRAGNLPAIINRPSDEQDKELLYRTLLDLRTEISSIKGMLQQLLSRNPVAISPEFSQAEEVEAYTLDEMEREQIQRSLTDHEGNRRAAARALGIGERTLYRKLKKYDL